MGLDNYVEAIKDESFQRGVGRVALFMLIQVPVMLLLALVFALILDSSRVWLPKLYRVGIFVPYAVPTVIAALMWGFIYGRDFGLFADIADALGTTAPNFLGEQLMLFSIANVSTWTYTGYNMIILYAALRSIPSELYEAAAVDGANPVRTAIHIKLPLLRPALLLCAIFSVIGSFQLFAEPQIFRMLAPGVIGTDYTPNLYVYYLAFSDQRLNYAAAISFLLGAGRLHRVVLRDVRLAEAGGAMSAVPTVTARRRAPPSRRRGTRKKRRRAARPGRTRASCSRRCSCWPS